jgi:hypothetical protein
MSQPAQEHIALNQAHRLLTPAFTLAILALERVLHPPVASAVVADQGY